MARLDIVVDDEVDKKFRNTVYRIYGFKKGNIKIAAEEAIELWLKTKK